MKKRAIFLDRDGTLNEDVGYPNSFDQIKIFPFSFEAVKKINQAGFLAVIVTNQSGIGRGLLTEGDLNKIHKKLCASFAAQNSHLDGVYFCPHYELSSLPLYKKNCACRKPETGMAVQAAADLNLDLKNSYMIGDKVEDVLFGLNIQAFSILVLTGFGQESRRQLKEMGRHPCYTAGNVLEAVDWILKREKNKTSVSG